MHFTFPLLRGRLIRRYKRFLADVELDGGQTVTAHVPNSGAMLGLDGDGLEAWLSLSDNPKRKLAHTLEMVRADGVLVGVNTMHPNALVAEAITAGRIPELGGTARLRREVKYGRNSRIDILLEEADGRRTFVEVKNVHLRRPHVHNGRAAEFPDCPTARGAKHLEELAAQVADGHRAVMLYLVQRTDCDHFRIAEDIDPAYARGLTVAKAAGVEAFCYACTLSPEGIDLDRPLPIHPPATA
ncbi:MAG TPA: DNA/RNA nuclease SfsA [Azospirillaceae bacterium]|nr:DNA/RNA nuclease SfsA [Azospirillaceae bacterium]